MGDQFVLLSPGGRLTLSPGRPVMTQDVVGATTIYYDSYQHAAIPIWDGSQWRAVLIPNDEISLTLDPNAAHLGSHASGSLFDLFALLYGGTLTLGTGPAWTNLTARSVGLARLPGGLRANSAVMTLRFGAASEDTIVVPAFQASYLGTFYATANGQTGMALFPGVAPGGTNNVLGLYNGYNRRLVHALCYDGTTSWNYAGGTVRMFNNSAGNRITFVDGLQESSPLSIFLVTVASPGVPNSGYTSGTAYDGTVAFGAGPLTQGAFAAATNTGTTLTSFERHYPMLGLHFVQALEQSTPAGMTVFANGFSGLELSLGM